MAAMLAVSSTGVARADTPGPHPHYLHALSDLRHARAWLTALGENNVMGREMDAVANIDKTIADLKQASIDDGKDLNDHPPVDTTIKHGRRLHNALDLLKSARKDIDFTEGDPAALGWRDGARKHLDDAIKATHEAMRDAKDDKAAATATPSTP